jgi:hypothetical protein
MVASSASAADAQAKSNLSGMVNVRFDPKQPPKVEDVHAVLAGLFRQNGCVTCGLTGIDLRLQLSDPAVRLKKMDNVQVPVEVTVQKIAGSR